MGRKGGGALKAKPRQTQRAVCLAAQRGVALSKGPGSDTLPLMRNQDGLWTRWEAIRSDNGASCRRIHVFDGKSAALTFFCAASIHIFMLCGDLKACYPTLLDRLSHCWIGVETSAATTWQSEKIPRLTGINKYVNTSPLSLFTCRQESNH